MRNSGGFKTKFTFIFINYFMQNALFDADRAYNYIYCDINKVHFLTYNN